MSYTKGSIEALDIATDAVVRETFHFTDSAGARWTLLPAGHLPYVARMGELAKSNGYRELIDKLRGNRSIIASLISGAKGDEDALLKAATINGEPTEAARELIDFRLRQRLDFMKGTQEMVQQADLSEVLEDKSQEAIEALAEELVLRVEKVPAREHRCSLSHQWQSAAARCPECGGKSEATETVEIVLEGADCLRLFAHPTLGQSLYDQVLTACLRREQELSGVQEAQVENLADGSASSGAPSAEASTS